MAHHITRKKLSLVWSRWCKEKQLVVSMFARRRIFFMWGGPSSFFEMSCDGRYFQRTHGWGREVHTTQHNNTTQQHNTTHTHTHIHTYTHTHIHTHTHTHTHTHKHTNTQTQQ